MTASPAPATDPVAGSRALTELLGQVEHRVSRRVEGVLDAEGLTLDQWRVLSLLADGAGHPMNEIAAHARVPAPTLTKIVDRLVDAALVYRRADEVDRRRVLVLLSDHGREVRERLVPGVARVDETIAAELGARDSARLADLLERVRALLA